MNDNKPDRELLRLQKRAQKMLSKDPELSDLEVAIISKLGHAKSMKDLSWFQVYAIEMTLRNYKV